MWILLLITSTFFNDKQYRWTVIAQQSSIIGDDDWFKAAVSHFPKQTADASIDVTINNSDLTCNRAQPNMNILGIGNGILLLNFNLLIQLFLKISNYHRSNWKVAYRYPIDTRW